jgi:hypothetical protein
MVTPSLVRYALKLALCAVFEDDRSCHPPLASTPW